MHLVVEVVRGLKISNNCLGIEDSVVVEIGGDLKRLFGVQFCLKSSLFGESMV